MMLLDANNLLPVWRLGRTVGIGNFKLKNLWQIGIVGSGNIRHIFITKTGVDFGISLQTMGCSLGSQPRLYLSFSAITKREADDAIGLGRITVHPIVTGPSAEYRAKWRQPASFI